MSQVNAYSVLWTDTAEKNAQDIVYYLSRKWTQKEIDAFLNEVDKIVNAIQVYPKLFKSSIK